jgi:hypothetical protein
MSAAQNDRASVPEHAPPKQSRNPRPVRRVGAVDLSAVLRGGLAGGRPYWQFGARRFGVVDRRLLATASVCDRISACVSGVDGEEPPGARYDLELMVAAVDERDPGAGDEVHDGSRNEEFARSGD